MAVTNSSNKTTSAGNGVATEFYLQVKCFSLDDVKVYQKIAGVETEVTSGITKSAISGLIDNGVKVTFDTAPVQGTIITLIRELSATQPLELEVGGNLPANEVEDAFDRSVMLVQQLDERIDRTIIFPVSDVGNTYEVDTAEARAGKALGFDGDGNLTELSLSGEGGAFTAVDGNKGLSASGGTLSAKVDDVTVEFQNGNIAVKDGSIGAAQLASSLDLSLKSITLPEGSVTKDNIVTIANMKLLGNVSGSTAHPAEVAFINDSTFASATTTNVPSATSVKAYHNVYALRYIAQALSPVTIATTGTDVDLSSYIGGAFRAMVFLKVWSTSNVARNIYFLTKGDSGAPVAASAGGTASVAVNSATSGVGYLSLFTDASGIITGIAITTAATNVNIILLGYQRVL